MKKFLLSFMLLMGAFAFVYAQPYYIKDYHVEVMINKDGKVDIKETLLADFTMERHGIIRFVPYKVIRDGEKVNFKITNAMVKDHPFKTYTENGNFVFKIGDANAYVNGEVTYEISYTMNKPFLYHEDFTEFYFNLIGTQWDTHIDAASFVVNFDGYHSLQPEDYKAFYGPYGSETRIEDIDFSMKKMSGKVPVGLNAGEGMTIAIKLPLDAVARPSEGEIWWKENGPFSVSSVFGVIFAFFFYNTWKKHGKDLPIVKAARFTPPPGLNPAEVGTIIDERADTVDIMALLPYWAHEGLIRIEQREKNWFKDDYELIKLAPLPVDAKSYERTIFNRLFTSGDRVLISSLKDTFYTTLNAARSDLQQQIKQRAYTPESGKKQVIIGLLSGLTLVLGIVLTIFMESIYPALFMGITAIFGFILTAKMLKKNEEGLHLYQETYGFKMFVQKADKPRLERLLKDDPMYFEKTLPFAMVFGYTKEWSKKFDGLLTQPPSWYVGYGPHASFSPSDFGKSFDGGIREMQSAFASSPSSSGSGGGGFSGGGAGGGGGSSW